MAKQHSRFVVYAALVGNILVAITKFVAAFLTGSSSMWSEAIHSVVDTGNEFLLLYGYRRSTRRPDKRHPLGYGRELYFWSFVVALLLFTVGAGLAIYEGIDRIRYPEPLRHVLASYCVLAASALFEGITWIIALRAFQSTKRQESYLEAIKSSKDPPGFMVLLEDSAALVGLAIAGIGIFLSTWLEDPRFDGVTSVLIGVVLGVIALIIARESKGLLIGERAEAKIDQSVSRIALSEELVEGLNDVMSLHLAPDQIVIALSLEFADDICTAQIEKTVQSMETRIQKTHPEVVAIFLKPQTRAAYKQRVEQNAARWPET